MTIKHPTHQPTPPRARARYKYVYSNALRKTEKHIENKQTYGQAAIQRANGSMDKQTDRYKTVYGQTKKIVLVLKYKTSLERGNFGGDMYEGVAVSRYINRFFEKMERFVESTYLNAWSKMEVFSSYEAPSQ